MEQETEEGMLRRAYMLGMQLKNSNLDEEIIYARLEKQGIREDIAWRVAKDITLERHQAIREESKPREYLLWIRMGLVGLAMVVSLFFIPGIVIFPLGAIIMAGIYLLNKK